MPAQQPPNNMSADVGRQLCMRGGGDLFAAGYFRTVVPIVAASKHHMMHACMQFYNETLAYIVTGPLRDRSKGTRVKGHLARYGKESFG